MGIIFDLDQTLIDSNIALEARKNRDWKTVYSLIPKFSVYDDMNNLIKLLQDNNIPICVVTSSPRSYCEKILSYFNWHGFHTVCYHDTKRKKPYSDPIKKGIELLNCSTENIISVGDDCNDIIASRSAGIISIGITWSGNNNFQNSNPDYIFHTVSELTEYIIKKFNIKIY